VDKTKKTAGLDSDESRFNETLKRMLKTPPKPHDKGGKANESSGTARRPAKTGGK